MKNIKIFMACLIFSTISFAKDIVLDVRTATEFQSAHTKNAINLDVTQDDFKNQILKFNKTDQYKIYCRSGHRAGNAVEIMKGLGFLRLENLGSLENAKKVLGE